jgi:hypothetical protein
MDRILATLVFVVIAALSASALLTATSTGAVLGLAVLATWACMAATILICKWEDRL